MFNLGRFRPKPRFTVRICLLSTTGRLLYFIRKNRASMDFNETINGVNYRIRKEGAYEKSPWLYKAVYWRIRNHKEYWIPFNEGEPDPIIPSNPAVTPYELYIINNSTAMNKGISDYLSKTPFGTRGIFIALILGLVLLYIVSNYLGVKLI